MKKYLIVLEKTKRGFSAYSPDIPGCIATGRTRKETEENIYNAIQFHLEGMREEGLRLPENTTESEMLVFTVAEPKVSYGKK
ncbi:MAG: type II toxin-antitoxin system HicB family antitoxin [Bacteroidetes bacterium]|nr:type II toxin-antitoxin system HicB family antitoxin [Bacteroidota bacterium]